MFSLYPITAMALCAIIVSATSNAATENKGTVSGNVTVLSKKFFGGLKKKKDMSKTVVYITGFKTEAPEEVLEVKQKNKRFVPVILPVVAGQQVRFPNQDEIYHNVFSISPSAQFDLGQYKDVDPPKMVAFENYGVVPVYCNIHPKMIAYVVVLENSAFAMTDKAGSFQINNLPPGTYTINAWRPKAKRANQQITVLAGQNVEVQLEVKDIEKIKPHKRKDGSQYPDDYSESEYER